MRSFQRPPIIFHFITALWDSQLIVPGLLFLANFYNFSVLHLNTRTKTAGIRIFNSSSRKERDCYGFHNDNYIKLLNAEHPFKMRIDKLLINMCIICIKLELLAGFPSALSLLHSWHTSFSQDLKSSYPYRLQHRICQYTPSTHRHASQCSYNTIVTAPLIIDIKKLIVIA